ncbi:P-loop containing nucleoside triphosphate hydrolase protein [Metschnikowia bicuspidata var. bicuspidata NRRL YB-4993]|uniref:p-loop containing nucleoside triphosphate hydrolase protein n=1 Tax=Metschnikowia bicuspidata var. bicuspidata NRRL YB-4993 TaxID=869754 RepID=A0A1A0HE41_9ASCO|nr:P-loop containing nucleoside triphosphate hydrolase protein [Metschnikowia bicuspidata var. bicuspidata NRRL YB-4993]OBA22374.1 P-loop containing nucleoside triphosphate hydrolase protein [Metschnikowia bicuspidata var. bicuspidata NRRL YB-4993]
MSYNLYLEEKISASPDSKQVLNSRDFYLNWEDECNMTADRLSLEVPINYDFQERFMSKKQADADLLPFYRSQSMILLSPDTSPLFCYVGSAKLKREEYSTRKGMKSKVKIPKVMDLSIQRYPWNKKSFSTSQGIENLKILPVSVPSSRSYQAMLLIQVQKIRNLLLGKMKIQQSPILSEDVLLDLDSLNKSQKQAVQTALNNFITIIQGPPGTGKTCTIQNMVTQLLKRNKFPILVIAASNLAVDNIAEKLLMMPKDTLVRLVGVARESEYPKNSPLGHICLHNNIFDLLPDNIKSLVNRNKTPGEYLHPEEYKQMTKHVYAVSELIMKRSKVIFCTSVAAGGGKIRNVGNIPVVIMDEATQSNEVISLIPLSLQGVEKFVFVGDQKQLSSFSNVPALSFSLFERMMENGSYENPVLLDLQYRMHPELSKFPRNEFYGRLLKDGINASDRLKYGPLLHPTVFWDTLGSCPEKIVVSQSKEKDSCTYSNPGEIKCIEQVLEHLIQKLNVDRSDIGVTSPYRGQRDLISRTLLNNKFINMQKTNVEVQNNNDDGGKAVTVHSVSGIMIASIDAFQGREKNFVVFSCVRSNEMNKIGFLKDRRRLNVALTRAKYGLVLVGDFNCLSVGDKTWRSYLKFLEAKDCILRTDYKPDTEIQSR